MKQKRHVVIDRFNGKPLTVTIIRGDERRVYQGRQAKMWAEFFSFPVHKRQTFLVMPSI